MILTSCTPALGMLTLPLVSLSKPVGPVMRQQIFDLRSRTLLRAGRLRPEFTSGQKTFIITTVPNTYDPCRNPLLSPCFQRTVWAFPFPAQGRKGRAIRFYSSALSGLWGNRCYPRPNETFGTVEPNAGLPSASPRNGDPLHFYTSDGKANKKFVHCRNSQ